MIYQLPPLKALPVFVAVAKHLSFTKAAAELSLTHSAVSQAVKQLESYLGCKLFERTTSHVSLSRVGQRYLVDIDAAMNQISHASSSVRQSEHWVNVNLMSSLALHWLIPNLTDFQLAYPEAKINLSTTAEPLYSSLDRNEIEVIIACQPTPVINDSYYTVKLWDDELVLVANPMLLNKRTKRLDIPALLQRHSAIYVDAQLRKNNWRQWCKQMRVKEPVKKQRYMFPSTTQAIQAAISGMGLLVTHEAFVGDNITHGLLQKVGSESVKTGFQYYLVCLKEKMSEPKIMYFISYIQSVLERHNK